MYKFDTEYESNNIKYASEIFLPEYISNVEVILDLRSLPNEKVISEPTHISHDDMNNPSHDVNKESVAYYIRRGKYVDAVHRLMYLTLIKGQSRVDLFEFMKDDGLMHQLVHLKSYQTKADVAKLIIESNEFEKTVPGTFLWATSYIMT